jgi:hypothetical protein
VGEKSCIASGFFVLVLSEAVLSETVLSETVLVLEAPVHHRCFSSKSTISLSTSTKKPEAYPPSHNNSLKTGFRD